MRRWIAGLVTFYGVLCVNASADENIEKRIRSGSSVVLEIAVNSQAWVGKRFEGLCPIAAIDVTSMTCQAFNNSGVAVGVLVVFIDDMPPKQSIDLLNRCANPKMESIKNECVIYFQGRVDEDGYAHASNFETVVFDR